jgi:hypothetical protein
MQIGVAVSQDMLMLSELGHHTASFEPVREGQRNGTIKGVRAPGTPFVISWSDGEIETLAADDPRTAQIAYCPDMNSGQEWVIRTYAEHKSSGERLMMLAMKIASLGQDSEIAKVFEETIEYQKSMK